MTNIKLKGVKQNNLKNIDVSIPLGSFTVICGPSGSGKSSLAFQTLFAEGQRRYIESLSNYSKQFINKAPKPDLEDVENIPPAIALQQKNSIKNSRSTIGTNTELIDHLRVLYAKLGKAKCPDHYLELKSYNPAIAAEYLVEHLESSKGYILMPVYSKLVSYKDKELLKVLLQEGFLRGAKFKTEKWKSGQDYYLTDDIALFEFQSLEALSYIKDDFYVVIDRCQIEKDELGRLYDSLYLCFSTYLKIHFEDSFGDSFFWSLEKKLYRFSEENSCPICDFKFPVFTPQLFSYNSPVGACTTCKGFGNTLEIDEKKVIPFPNKTLMEGAITPFAMPSGRADFRKLIKFCESESIDLHTPWEKLPAQHKEMIWKGHKKWFGVLGLFEYLETKKYKMHIRVFLSRYKSSFVCPTCHGDRLKPEINQITFKDFSISALCKFTLKELEDFFKKLKLSDFEKTLCKEVLEQIQFRLEYLNKVGLGYLSLDRQTRTLSGGEFQRMNLAHQLGMGLSQTLFVLDEPTIGLHPRDNDRLIEILKNLHELGNTLVVVEHDHDVILRSDRVMELGPGSGHKGGEIIFDGKTKDFLKSESLTANYLRSLSTWSPEREVRSFDPKSDEAINLIGASGHNLKKVNLHIPLKKFTTVTGVSGSGKSSLITQTLYPQIAYSMNIPAEPALVFKSLQGHEKLKNVILMDQAPAGKTVRSSPATYLKIYDLIRTLFSSTRESKFFGFAPGTFSLNVDGGRCPTCRGLGFEAVDMIFMDDIHILCEDCKGKRFRDNVLKVTFNGKNIHDVLEMTIEEAYKFFVAYPNIRKPLGVLKEVGLEHLKLGQSLSTLSGGENQRLKLTKHFLNHEFKDTLYILDEPTTGLHFREIEMLLKVLHKLVDSGATVVVIEHNLEIVKNSDWVIDLGPEAGQDGGTILFTGTPRDLTKQKSHTGKYLKSYMNL
jgi:excinuclease ABC subunit A